jgi:hypothetical protein
MHIAAAKCGQTRKCHDRDSWIWAFRPRLLDSVQGGAVRIQRRACLGMQVLGPAMAGPLENVETRTLQHWAKCQLEKTLVGRLWRLLPANRFSSERETDARRRAKTRFEFLEGAGVAGPSDNSGCWAFAVGVYLYLAGPAAQRRVRFTSHLSHAWEQTVHRE